jgi:GNAT superfamily N-acetyltransferase
VQPQIEQLSERPDLLPTIAVWIYSEWWTEVEGATVGTLTDLLRAHLTADQIPVTLVASLECSPVGTATLLAHDVETEEWPDLSPWLAAVYVMPQYRRRGIGAALINAIVEKAASLGVGVLYLSTVGREEFYAGLGWQVIHRSEDKVVMSRSTVGSQ